MRNWGRFIYQPVLPMGKDGTRITGSKEHIALSREAAREGMVLLKNEQMYFRFRLEKRSRCSAKAAQIM